MRDATQRISCVIDALIGPMSLVLWLQNETQCFRTMHINLANSINIEWDRYKLQLRRKITNFPQHLPHKMIFSGTNANHYYPSVCVFVRLQRGRIKEYEIRWQWLFCSYIKLFATYSTYFVGCISLSLSHFRFTCVSLHLIPSFYASFTPIFWHWLWIWLFYIRLETSSIH